MNIKTLDERIREQADAEFKERVIEAFQPIMALIHNQTAVQGVTMDGKDVIDMPLLERLRDHIIKTQRLLNQESEIERFIDMVNAGGHAPSTDS